MAASAIALLSSLVLQTVQPNIVLVVADDLGYGEPGCYGGVQVPTPNIDSIAANGVRMSAGYATCPMCAPSRAGLITGRYQQRFGFEFNPLKDQPTQGLPATEITLGERLKAAGYKTGLVGKWHLGEAEGMRPWERGYDDFFGFLGGGSQYLPRTSLGVPLYDGPNATFVFDYLTEELTRRSVSFIDQNAHQPFFLTVAYNAVHVPYQAPAEYTAPFDSLGLTENRHAVAGMLSAMDQGIGEVRAALTRNGLLKNTLFIFIGDNGGQVIDGIAYNQPFRGSKGTINEGGLRVPYIVSWPQRLVKGKTYDYPVSTMDLVPTVMTAVGKPVTYADKLDGVNLLPFLNGYMSKRPHETLYFRIGDRMAVRHGDMKFATWARPSDGKIVRALYDLSADPKELKDLRFVQPETTTTLRQMLNSWSNRMAPASWSPY